MKEIILVIVILFGIYTATIITKRDTENLCYKNYCNYYNMEYHEHFKCCIDINKNITKRIEWMKK